MALTALEIYKHLPKTNCSDCGVPTCLAFAMKLASKQAELSSCPHVSDDATQLLESSAAPPIKLVEIGAGPKKVEIGKETELFRHDKTFHHPTAFAALISDSMDDDTLLRIVEKANAVDIERVGQQLHLDLLAVRCVSGDAGRYQQVLKLVQVKNHLPLILVSEDPDILKAGLEICHDKKPLLYGVHEGTWGKLGALAKDFKCPLVVSGNTLDELADLTEKMKSIGVENLVLDFGKLPLSEMLANLTHIRRLAIKKGEKRLGFPVIMNLEGMDPDEAFIRANLGVMKYASAMILGDTSLDKLFPLLTMRQNIFTDPQKPLQMNEGLYQIGNPTPESPLLLTTNFSLTYFTVAADIESSKVPAHLLVVDTEGMSVLTAYAADKYTPEIIKKAFEKCGVSEKVSHDQIVIPGLVARMSGKLEEELGRKVMVGPRESGQIPKYMKENFGN